MRTSVHFKSWFRMKPRAEGATKRQDPFPAHARHWAQSWAPQREGKGRREWLRSCRNPLWGTTSAFLFSWLRVWGGVLGQKVSARKEREQGWFLFSPSCQMSAYWLCVTNTMWRQAWDVTTYSTVISKIKFPIQDRLQWRTLVVYLLCGRRK